MIKKIKGNKILQIVILFIIAKVFIFIIGSIWREVASSNESISQMLFRFDSAWYSAIVDRGYDVIPNGHTKGDAASWAFFPLYPLIVKGFVSIFNCSIPFAGMVVSSIFTFIAGYVLYEFVSETINEKVALISVTLLFVGPYSFYMSSMYTEALYILLTISAFYLLYKDKWILAGLCGGLLSATRVTGVLFVIPMIVKLVTPLFKKEKSFIQIVKEFFADGKYFLSFLLVPSGLIAYMSYLYWYVGDTFAFQHIQIAWNRENSNPITMLINGFKGIGYGGDKAVYFSTWALIAILLSIYLMCTKRIGEGLFSLVAITIPLMSNLQSIPRYCIGNIFFFIALSEIIYRLFKRKSWIAVAILIAFNGYLLVSWFQWKWFMP